MTTKLATGLSRRTVIALAVVLGVAAVGLSGWVLYRKTTAHHPPTTAEVKRSIWKFLAAQTGDATFTAPPDIPTNGMATSVTVTNKSGRIKTVRPMWGLPQTGESAYFRTNQAQAASYPEMYRLLGQQLTLAERLLESGENRQQMIGLVLASEAITYARTNAMNLWLGARICEAYLWPNLSLVETNDRTMPTTDRLLRLCESAFEEAGETNNLIRNYEYRVTKGEPPSDSVRYRLARLYQDKGEDAKALAQLKQIKDYKMQRVERDIANLEKSLGAQKK